MAVDPNEISIEDYNKRVTEWGTAVTNKIRSRIQMLTNKGKGDLLKKLRLKTAKWNGEVDKLSFHFPRHGVFVHKGVGRGYVMEGGTVRRGEKGNEALSNNVNWKLRQAVMRSARINRKPVEWFNPVVEEDIKLLADLVAEMDADRLVNATKLLIN